MLSVEFSSPCVVGVKNMARRIATPSARPAARQERAAGAAVTGASFAHRNPT